MSTINIRLFGRFEISTDDLIVDCFQSQKALELFCFLMLFRDQPHRREQLADIFWGQRCTSESKKYLRKTLWQLQSSLEKFTVPGQAGLIRIEPDWLQINREVGIWLDVLEFEHICTSLLGIRGSEFNPHQFQVARRAVKLYRGDLLEGCYHDWCIYERERFKDMYFMLVDKIMGYCETNQYFEFGILYGRKLLTLDWARESTHLRLMRLYHLAGDRTSALRQYEACQDALRNEFNIEPGNEVLEFYHQLTKYALDELISRPDLIQEKPSEIRFNSEITASLTKIQELLAIQASIAKQIIEEIQAIQEKLSENV